MYNFFKVLILFRFFQNIFASSIVNSLFSKIILKYVKLYALCILFFSYSTPMFFKKFHLVKHNNFDEVYFKFSTSFFSFDKFFNP